MNKLIKLLYSEYFLAKSADSRFCTREECRNNFSMTSDEKQLEALKFLIKYRTE